MNIIVTGASSGLGRAICSKLYADHYVIGLARFRHEIELLEYADAGLQCDLSANDEIVEFGKRIFDMDRPIHAIINCAGVNELNPFEAVGDEFEESMAINAKSIVALAQTLLPFLQATQGTILNILSDAAWRPMTASLAYNASKAAAQMITLQMARELGRRHNLTIFGIAPAKIQGTPMSSLVDLQVSRIRGWTLEYTEQYHRQNVLMKEDIPVDVLANFVKYLFEDKLNHKWFNGCIIPYGG